MNRCFLSCWIIANSLTLCTPTSSAYSDENMLQNGVPAGLYTGIGVGIGGGRSKQNVSTGATTFPNQDYGTFGSSGYLMVGYDFDIGNQFIAGIRADIAVADENFTYFSSVGVPNTFQLSRRWSYGARLGNWLNSDQLWYLSAGISRAHYNYSTSDKTFTGHYGALGVETRLSPSVSLILEGRYENYGQAEVSRLGSFVWREQPGNLTLMAGFTHRFEPSLNAGKKHASMARNWQGFYLGGGIGYDAFTGFLDRSSNGADSQDYGRLGVTGYVQAGFDYQFASNWMAGVFGDYSYGNKTAHDMPRNTYIEDTPQMALGARFGYALNADALIFASGGYAQHKLDVRNDALQIDQQIVSGWFVGAGVETRLIGDLFLKFEYRVETLNDTAFQFSAGHPNYELTSANNHLARIGMTYRF